MVSLPGSRRAYRRNAEKECPAGGPGEGRTSPEVPGQTPGLAILPAVDVNASHQPGPRELCGRACFTKCRAELHGSALHIQAHANSSALSKHAPWAGDKRLGRNGIPKPAGAGGGSSSLSLAPDAGPTRLNNLEITPRRPPEGGNRSQSSRRARATSSSKTSARRIASTSTTAPLSRRRKEGAFSTTRASDIQDARTALFSAKVSLGSLATSSGWT
jgi:hypothetical protein